MITIGICDDEEIFRDQVKNILESYFKKEKIEYKIYEYNSAEQFMKSKVKIDILLLDIEMKEMNGIQLKNWLEKKAEIRILFLTSHSEVWEEAFGKNVYGFLRKPIEIENLIKYIKRILKNMQEEKNIIIDGIEKGYIIPVEEIMYFKASKKYSYVVTKEEIFCEKGLIELEKDLKGNFFFRCHKSYLVNLRNIRKIEDKIYMKNGEKIPVSREKKKELKEVYLNYIVKVAI